MKQPTKRAEAMRSKQIPTKEIVRRIQNSSEMSVTANVRFSYEQARNALLGKMRPDNFFIDVDFAIEKLRKKAMEGDLIAITIIRNAEKYVFSAVEELEKVVEKTIQKIGRNNPYVTAKTGLNYEIVMRSGLVEGFRKCAIALDNAMPVFKTAQFYAVMSEDDVAKVVETYAEKFKRVIAAVRAYRHAINEENISSTLTSQFARNHHKHGEPDWGPTKQIKNFAKLGMSIPNEVYEGKFASHFFGKFDYQHLDHEKAISEYVPEVNVDNVSDKEAMPESKEKASSKEVK